MSTIIVQVKQISEIKPHPNADKLEIAIVGGWQVVVGKGTFKAGDRVVYVPPDAVLELWLSEQIGVTKYLSNGRVKVAKLRNEPSVGLVFPAGDGDVEGENLAAKYKITKYEPPIKFSAAGKTPTTDFYNYTDIENLRHFPEVLNGMKVYATEKLHGTMCCVAKIKGEFRARSKGLERNKGGIYWHPIEHIKGVADLLDYYSGMGNDVQLFGEIYGAGIQDLTYGLNGIDFRPFDLMINGRYVDGFHFNHMIENFDLYSPKPVYFGDYNFNKLAELVEGDSLESPGQIMEGVVVRPYFEKTDYKHGRHIFKLVSNRYMTRGKEDFKDE